MRIQVLRNNYHTVRGIYSIEILERLLNRGPNMAARGAVIRAKTICELRRKGKHGVSSAATDDCARVPE